MTTGVGTYDIDVVAPIVDDHPNETEFPLASEIVLSQITGAAGLDATISPRLDTDLFFFRTLAASTPSEPGAHRIVFDARAGGFEPILTVYNQAQTPLDLIADNGPLDEDATIGVVRYTLGHHEGLVALHRLLAHDRRETGNRVLQHDVELEFEQQRGVGQLVGLTPTRMQFA